MSEKYKTDDIDKFFDYDLSLSTRTIFLSTSYDAEEAVDPMMVERVMKCLHVLDNLDESSLNGTNPITIIMNCPGGFYYDGLAIYDAIRACKNHVTIKVFGVAMSMGSVILQAADKRVLSPNSTMMIHYGEGGGEAYHLPTVRAWGEEDKRLSKMLEDLYMEKIRQKQPKFRRDKLKKWLTIDTFFAPKEAIEIGLADEILE